MKFSEKIRAYFKDKELSNRDISEIMEGYNEILIGRYLKSDELSAAFLSKLIQYFPDIDLNMLLKDDEVYVSLNEREKKTKDLLDEIQVKLDELKSVLAQ